MASDSSRARAAYVRKLQHDRQLAEARDRRAAAAALDAGFMGDDFSSDQLADECVTRALPKVPQTLPHVPAGKLGKLRLRRSGRVELVIGGVSFLLQAAEQVRHYEEAVQMDLPGAENNKSAECKTGSCCLLGRVTHHVTVVPGEPALPFFFPPRSLSCIQLTQSLRNKMSCPLCATPRARTRKTRVLARVPPWRFSFKLLSFSSMKLNIHDAVQRNGRQ